MHTVEDYIVYPEGDAQGIPHSLGINQVVDLNGRPLALPLSSPKTIAYRVARIRVSEGRGSTERYHDLELLSREELEAYGRGAV